MGAFSKPILQLHIKLPFVLTQFALVTFPFPQFPLFTKHSFMSKKLLSVYFALKLLVYR